MKTRTIMLTSLAIAALATVTLNATEALAKSGGGGGSGMGSFSSARSLSARTPVVVKQFKSGQEHLSAGLQLVGGRPGINVIPRPPGRR